MSDLSNRLASLSPEKRQLLELLRKEKRAESRRTIAEANGDAGKASAPSEKQPFALISEADKAKLPRDVAIEDAYPMTALQLGMLYHMELAADPSSPHYHNVNSFHLRVPFDGEAFVRAVERVVARHETLRTAFDFNTYSEPMQLVHRTATLPVHIEDWRHLSYDEQQKQLEAFWEIERARLFDLARPSLMRFHIHRRTEDTLQLTLTELHAISDGWSTTSTLAEIFKNYFALLKNQPLPDVPPLAASYRDFVVLERQALESVECRQYWARKLSDSTVMKLPRLPRRFQTRHPDGLRKRLIPFTADVVDGLNRVARLAQVPLKSVLLAAHMKVMSLLSGQTDIMTGLLCNGRPEEADGELIRGLFLNTVPFRLNLPDGTWLELVRETFGAEVELLPYRRYPLAALQQKWGAEPLFEAAFTYLNFHSVGELFKRDDFEYLHYGDRDLGLTHFALSVIFQMNPASRSSMALILDHDPNVLSEQQFESIIKYFQHILRAIASDPTARHHTQSFLTEAEQQQLFIDWNATDAPYPHDATIHQLFEAQVERTSDAVAVRFKDESLSYRELNSRANQLAHYLRRQGAGTETLLGICMERSTEMIVSILAALKTGSAYVPLDPAYPQERLDFMLEDSRARLLLTQSTLLESLPEHSTQVVCVDTEATRLTEESRDNPRSSAVSDNLAYVIYTSGSTGRPKGVMVSHGSFCNLMQAQIRIFDVQTESRVLQFASFSFDASQSEIFMALLSGAALQLEAKDEILPGASLIDFLRERAITTVTFPPSALSSLPQAELPDLHTIVVAGESCPAELVSQWSSGRRFINAYGPTEATVCATAAECHEADAGERPTIGRPIQNTQVYVLDKGLLPVPVGVSGEVYIAGVGLARGYLHQPALTAERFIPHPFSESPGARMYRTGDLARYLPNGNLDFLGRVDQQVKVRGFRIEPGEIETTLRKHPSVREAFVTISAETPLSQRLVAYFVADAEPSPASRELRSFLRQSLPDYMIPSTFIALARLPLTPSGKIDRAALPNPERVSPEIESQYAAPGTPVEEILAGIWEEVLGVERVGVHDSFLEIGGHSLLATSVITRVRETFQLDITLRTLFDAPTVGGLAQHVESALRAKQNSPLPPLERVSDRRNLPLSFAQRRVWFFDQMEPGNPAYNIPFAVRLRGSLDVAALERALGEIVARHEALRTTFPTVDSQPVQHIAEPAPFTLHVVDLSSLENEDTRQAEVQRLAEEEARRGFDLSAGPLFRAVLLRVEDAEHVALVTMHHIISDGWSIGILVREVAALYDAFAGGKASPLAPLAIQYADYAVWQREWLRGDVLERQLSYWREQLTGAPPVLELPTDHPPLSAQTFRGGRHSLVLSSSLADELKALSRREGATLFMTMLAAFNILLQRYTGQRDIIIGSPVAGRSRSVTEGLIGFFVNMLALRTRLHDNPTFRELLNHVRETTLGAYTHQDLPFEKLIEELHPERNQSQVPLFNVMLVFQNAPMSTLEMPGLQLSLLDVDKGTAKLDLSVYVEDTRRGLAITITYNSDLMKQQTIIQMLSRFQTLLESITAAPENRISTFSIISQEENAELSNAFNEPLEML
jgi:amino acid adenylation domain-containing protein